MFQVQKEGSKQNILVSDFWKMFARQISKVQLHRRRLQSAQKLESWCTTLKARHLQYLNVSLFCALDSLSKLTAR